MGIEVATSRPVGAMLGEGTVRAADAGVRRVTENARSPEGGIVAGAGIVEENAPVAEDVVAAVAGKELLAVTLAKPRSMRILRPLSQRPLQR